MIYDVIVVGCGVAGLSAALTAAQGGARVALLERADKENRGGSSKYTEAYLRMKSETEVQDDFEDKLARSSTGTIDPELLKMTTTSYDQWPPMLKAYGITDPELITSFADGAPETIAWLKTLGVKFFESSPYITQKHSIRLVPSGGGAALVEAMATAAEKKGVDFCYQTTARSLIQDEQGKVIGVHASHAEGNKDFKGNAVVLASGGYEGNLEMMIKYIGYNAYLTRPVAPGGLYNKGEGIEMALAIGAAPAGQFNSFHTEHLDPRSGIPEASVHVINYFILVNQSGDRFLDEGANLFEHIYDEVSWELLKQEKGIGYLIADSKTLEVKNVLARIKTDKDPIRAKSIKELAAKLEIDPDRLEKTIKGYNQAVQDGEFNSFELDGKCTKGIEPPKSNWAMRIDETDLIAYPIICGNVFTLGGLKITPKAEVVNQDGYPIPGLYAAGETLGLYYGSYVGGTSVLRGLIFGRKAGKEIASRKKQM